jgi:DivIVA domain-containing protein
MPLEPEDIQSQRFRLSFRGYDVEAVNHFLAQVARAYQLVLDAATQLKASELTASADDPFLDSAGGDILASAKESAHSFLADVRRDADKAEEKARAAAVQIREQAVMEAAATKEEAQESAAKLLDEAHALVAHAQQESESLKASQHDELSRIRSDALQESGAIVAATQDQAVSLLEAAEVRAREIITEAQRGYDERLKEIARRLAEMEAFEQALATRATALEELLKSAPTTIHDVKAAEAIGEGLESVAVEQELEQGQTA